MPGRKGDLIADALAAIQAGRQPDLDTLRRVLNKESDEDIKIGAWLTQTGLINPRYIDYTLLQKGDIHTFGARVLRTTAGGGASQSITNDTDTIITFNTEDYDDLNFWDVAAPTRLTIPDGYDGVYLVGIGTVWGVDADGYRRIGTAKNGTLGFSPHDDRPSTAVVSMNMSAVHERSLVGGDYIELNVKHTAGAALDATNPYMWIRKVR